MRVRRSGSACRPYGSFELGAARIHVDLLRVSSALCPGARRTR
ncbi:putative leader peptide [Actinacidiphila sp. ITFR-21]|nr:putative leader peptide [Streptomyces sp. ITFR-21]WNI18854.1 putative leader peptide [Streptomyces sp. ITFR-21]